MEPSIEDSQSTTVSPVELKSMKRLSEGKCRNDKVFSSSIRDGPEAKRQKKISKVDDIEPFASPNLDEGLDYSMFGSAGKRIAALRARKMEMLNLTCAVHSTPPSMFTDVEKSPSKEASNLVDQKAADLVDDDIIILDGHNVSVAPSPPQPIVIILDSDEEDSEEQGPAYVHQEFLRPLEKGLVEISLVDSKAEGNFLSTETEIRVDTDVYIKGCADVALTEEDGSLAGETEYQKDKGANIVDCSVGKVTQNGGSLAEEIELEKFKGVDDTDCAERKGLTETEASLTGEIELKEDKGANSTDGDKSKFLTEEGCLNSKIKLMKDKGIYVGVEDNTVAEEGNHQGYIEDDGLGDMWKEMGTALECFKDVDVDHSFYENNEEECDQYMRGQLWSWLVLNDVDVDHSFYENNEEECDHSFVLKDDIGDVCRICGFIKRRIENIFDFQYKIKRSSRTYMRESQNTMDREPARILLKDVELSEHDSILTELSPHPRHGKQMKPHQVEGFNFLLSNLMKHDPGGCILAHAPGSGKTFMMISFVQIFLAKYPHARVLVVLPKGILPTWRKEFEIWQVESIPLYDFYSAKADNRSQQLDVLNKWVEQKSILFLSYKQYSIIVCDNGTSEVAANCRELLLKVPGILILDEGHTSRNDDTDIFGSLAKIQTPRRVVLSGTLYQNHVKEVFNILNLVRPGFLKLDTSTVIYKRIMSRVHIPSVRKQLKGSAVSAFYDVVEHTLQKDEDLKRKELVIQDLREMTSKVLHYYKGDFLDELPGLVDFTVLLNLSAKQNDEVKTIKKLDNFKRGSVGSLVYVHPELKYFSENNLTTGNRCSFDTDEKMDELLKKISVRDGVKAKFFFNILRLCETAGEKLLVFSQYLLPLKFLERLAAQYKGWILDKELFMISGESNSEHRERSMDRFNSSSEAKIFFGSIKACGEGISLVGASRILILDVHLNPSVTRQAIGRAFRPGQTRKVYTYRLVAANSPDEEDHLTCFRKELISKMWFEYNEYSRHQGFEMKTLDRDNCGDKFLENPLFRDDIKVLYRR